MTKFIHCSDVHLLTPFRARLMYSVAKQRFAEIFQAFENMLEYADKEGVSFVLICGDLFDGENIDISGFDAVSKLFAKYPEIDFYIVCGNYDPYSDDCPYEIFKFPKNVYVFKNRWDKLVKNGYAISGFSLYEKDKKVTFENYRPEPDSVNIVCLHGLMPGVPSPLEYNLIDFKTLKSKRIDYLALGHVHHYNAGTCEDVAYAYPGVLESRDFTDSASGFILGTVENGEVKTEFIKKEIRRHRSVSVSFPPLSTKKEQRRLIDEALKDMLAEDLVKLTLSGEVTIENLYGEKWLLREFRNRFFYLEIDNSKVALDKKKLEALSPATMQGSYYQSVMGNAQLNERERENILQYGLEAMLTRRDGDAEEETDGEEAL